MSRVVNDSYKIIFSNLIGGPGIGKTATVLEFQSVRENLRHGIILNLSCESQQLFVAELKHQTKQYHQIALEDSEYVTVFKSVKALIKKLQQADKCFCVLFDDAGADDTIKTEVFDALNSEDPQKISDKPWQIFLTMQKALKTYDPEKFEIVEMKGFTSAQFVECLRGFFGPKIEKLSDEQLNVIADRVGLSPVVLNSLKAEASHGSVCLANVSAHVYCYNYNF